MKMLSVYSLATIKVVIGCFIDMKWEYLDDALVFGRPLMKSKLMCAQVKLGSGRG
jgi:hypothetical protein